MTKKAKRLIEQKWENETVDSVIHHYNVGNYNFTSSRRLRSCNATVYDCTDYYALISYNTLIALIDKETGVCYDFLRKVYGYTSTSAQHISKFIKDYGNGRVYTWRDIPV